MQRPNKEIWNHPTKKNAIIQQYEKNPKEKGAMIKSWDKNIVKSHPKKSRDPGIWLKSRPDNSGCEILDPVRACPLSFLQKQLCSAVWSAEESLPWE